MKSIKLKVILTTLMAGLTFNLITPSIEPITTTFSASAAKSRQTNKAPNQLLHQYKIGDRAIYYGDNNRIVLAHFPDDETDTENPVHSAAIDNVNGVNYATVKIVATQVAPWQVRYYLIKFQDGTAGWVNSGDLHQRNFYRQPSVKYSNKTYQNAANTALNYLNAVRKRHHLQPLQGNEQLTAIAQARGPQMMIHFAHRTNDGVRYRQIASEQLGFGDLGDQTNENIANANNYRGNNPSQAIIQRINSMLYEDGVDSKWGHRNAFLDPNITEIGIAINTYNRMYNMAFIMK